MENIYVSVNLSSAQLRDDGIVDRVADLLAIPRPARAFAVPGAHRVHGHAGSHRGGRYPGAGSGAWEWASPWMTSAPNTHPWPTSSGCRLTVLKIDKSFVDSLLHEDTADASLIAAVVAMAKSLGITTVAEGVESSVQARRLVRLGVDAVQGYLFSRPVSADQLLEVTTSLSAQKLTLVGANAS